MATFSCQNPSSSHEINALENPKTDIIIAEDTAQSTQVPAVFYLDTLIDFDSIISISVRNENGLHDLDAEKWEDLKYTLAKSTYIYGLLCPRQERALIFSFKDGSELEAYFCSGHVNFASSRIHGSFRMPKVIDYDSL